MGFILRKEFSCTLCLGTLWAETTLNQKQRSPVPSWEFSKATYTFSIIVYSYLKPVNHINICLLYQRRKRCLNGQMWAHQDHTAGQPLSWEGGSGVVFLPPIIPVLLSSSQWLRQGGLSWANGIRKTLSWGKEIRKEKRYLTVLQASTEWHYHLVDYRANLKCVYIVGVWKLTLENGHLEQKVPFFPAMQRTVQSLTPTKTQWDQPGHLCASLHW